MCDFFSTFVIKRQGNEWLACVSHLLYNRVLNLSTICIEQSSYFQVYLYSRCCRLCEKGNYDMHLSDITYNRPVMKLDHTPLIRPVGDRVNGVSLYHAFLTNILTFLKVCPPRKGNF